MLFKLTHRFGAIFQRNLRRYSVKMSMQVTVLPALQDNYMYVITDTETGEAAAVDPVEPEKVIQFVNSNGYKLTTVLTTHHHYDHAGGNESLVKKYENPLAVYGGDDRIPALTKLLIHNDEIKIGSLVARAMYTPCHTSGHMCYFFTYPGHHNPHNAPAVFTGDTLFVAGCGRFFEGNATQMYSALIGTLGELPNTTKVYCGHEYTVDNLRFALKVDANNKDVQAKLDWAMFKRKHNQPTVPSTIGEEKKINPFMRVNKEPLKRYAGTEDVFKVMDLIRKEKNEFK